jgi:hypothetical protein
MPNARLGRTEIFSGEPILRGEIETRECAAGTQFVLAPGAAETTGTSIATQGRLTSPMCVCRTFATISGARNSRLSGQASGRSRHHRRHPSLVGARRLRPKMGAENCEGRRATRRTRLHRGKAILGRQSILPHFPALSRGASATATDRRLNVTRSRSCVCKVQRKRPKSVSTTAGYSDEKGILFFN